MKPMTAGIILSTVALLVQGTRCLIRQGAPPFVRRFGALTLLLAGLSAVLFVLLHFGEAVLSPEFDSVMARGHRRGLAALVLGLALAAGLGLHVQRLKADRPGRLAALLFLGVGVGALATLRITTLNPEETEAFQIYAYDLWWPPLLVWVSACFLEGAITILGVTDYRVRVGPSRPCSSDFRRRRGIGSPSVTRHPSICGPGSSASASPCSSRSSCCWFARRPAALEVPGPGSRPRHVGPASPPG